MGRESYPDNKITQRVGVSPVRMLGGHCQVSIWQTLELASKVADHSGLAAKRCVPRRGLRRGRRASSGPVSGATRNAWPGAPRPSQGHVRGTLQREGHSTGRCGCLCAGGSNPSSRQACERRRGRSRGHTGPETCRSQSPRTEDASGPLNTRAFAATPLSPVSRTERELRGGGNLDQL